MLKTLRIRNLATIEDIELEFNSGFSVLTGETGAGKSIVIESIRLVLGEKASSDIIRTGKSETSVETTFQIHSKTAGLDNFLYKDEDNLYLQRKIPYKGNGKAYINGTLVPINKIRQLSFDFVDIYGQNDHVFLRNIDNQQDFLDNFAHTVSIRENVSQLAKSLRRLTRKINSLQAREQDRAQRIDFLRYTIKEIENAELKADEEDNLQQERTILKNAEKINNVVEEALNISYKEESSILPLLTKLQNQIKELTPYDPEMKTIDNAVEQFMITLKEFVDYLINFKDRQENSNEKLEFIEERLSNVENLKRKYGKSIPEILSFLEKARNELNILGSSHEELTELKKEFMATFSKYKEKAQILSNMRKKAAKELEKRIEKEISILGMKKARFEIDIESTTPEPDNLNQLKDSGTDTVEFLLSPNPGEKPKPLRKIASGGELSRLMLALKSADKDQKKSKTFIFDEIDAGIGGKTADFVAQKLRALSKQNQVICITHLPQIASYAPHHYRIEKIVKNNRTYTKVKKLTKNERIEEIAKLLGGSHITDTTLKNAKELLENNLSK
jgi:DNA repair protein RecN (Recombination protein N)